MKQLFQNTEVFESRIGLGGRFFVTNDRRPIESCRFHNLINGEPVFPSQDFKVGGEGHHLKIYQPKFGSSTVLIASSFRHS